MVGKRTAQGTTARTRSPAEKPSPSNSSTWSSSEAIRVFELCAGAAAVVALDPARVRDLPAAGRVERRLAQLCQEVPTLNLFERADLRQDVRLLVADEISLEAGAPCELGRPLVVLGDCGSRALSLTCHQRGELLVVDSKAALARKLLGQLEGEAVRVVEPEGILPRDVAAPAGDLLEQAHAALECLTEALFLGSEDAMDLPAMLVELRVAALHLVDDDVGELREVRLVEPDT